jgi:MoxR-like ATPase
MNLTNFTPSSAKLGMSLPVTACDHAPPAELLGRMRAQLNSVLRGKPQVIERVLACLFARGHVLIEDLPGLGKTTLAKALAGVIGGRFNRLQCTPDLLPGDVTGFSVFNQKSREFEFLPGPVFTDILLVDEINRTTPRTQSALLEAMAEGQVTVDNAHHRLSESFFVIATQNPVEHQGTYPLPEAQLDRFAMKLRIGYPDAEHELSMLEAAVGHCCEQDSRPIEPVIRTDQLHHLQQHVAKVNVARPVRQYLVDLAAATRSHPQIPLGLSPRGLLTWQRAAQAWAWLAGRDFVTPDDIQTVALPVLDVRLGTPESRSRELVQQIVRSVAIPA